MFRKKQYLTLMLALFTVLANGQYQMNESLPHHPMQLSLVPLLGTGGKPGMETAYDFSLNVFGGITGATEKLEIGGFLNINRYYTRGLQISGFGNFTGLGDLSNTGSFSSGWQIAGFMNTTKGSFTGVNLAGFMNLVEQSSQNVQMSGFMNLSKITDRSTQISGFMNLSSAGETNVQISGFANMTEYANAAQISAFGNVAKQVNGVQASAFVNLAHYVDGLQLGIFNYVDSIDGVPIGFLSIVRHGGYRGFEISVDEVSYLSASYKIGVDQFYTIFNLSKLPGDASRWMYGFGFGSKQKLFHKIDGRVEFLSRQEFWIANNDAPEVLFSERTNMVNTLKIAFTKPLHDKVTLFLAPSLNVSVSDNEYSDYYLGPDVQPYWKAPSLTNDGPTTVRFWPGLSVGIYL